MHDERLTKVGKAVGELQACERAAFDADSKEVKISTNSSVNLHFNGLYSLKMSI